MNPGAFVRKWLEANIVPDVRLLNRLRDHGATSSPHFRIKLAKLRNQ